ncbi:MAG: hypothetical protein JXR77_05880 [Lentisphaeria bacterium]|nr:hypothetical protein [Lentisphaeria bacterium]
MLLLVMALVLPRVGRLPGRLRRERAVTAVRLALGEAALRARAQGRPVALVLVANDEGSRFLVRAGEEDAQARIVVREFTLALPAAGEGQGEEGRPSSMHLLPQTEFELPEEMRWDPDSLADGTEMGEEGPVYVFHVDGGAGGPELLFAVGKTWFRLSVDPLTARADVREIPE